MLWHIVTFRFPSDVSDGERRAWEASVAALPDTIDEIRCLRIARSIDDPAVTGLIAGFEGARSLAIYRDHRHHLPVVARSRELCSDISRLDIETADEPDILPRKC